MNDCAISFLDDLQNIYQSVLNCKCYDGVYKFKRPKLTFPLKKVPHSSAILEVQEWSKRNNLILPCVSCEHTYMGLQELLKDLLPSA